MCIGAQKAGTTWLYEMLRRHPQFWMPPVKELHYFDRSPSYSSDNFLASHHFIARCFGAQSHNREFRRKCRRLFRRSLRQRSWETFRWSLRFSFGRVDDEWYRSLFANAPVAIRGEITPSYTMLNDDDVARVQQLEPELKILLLLRNPIDRAWSQIRFDWARGVFEGIDDFARLQEFVDSPHQMLRSNYLRTLRIREKHFPKDQIFVGFYE